MERIPSKWPRPVWHAPWKNYRVSAKDCCIHYWGNIISMGMYGIQSLYFLVLGLFWVGCVNNGY